MLQALMTAENQVRIAEGATPVPTATPKPAKVNLAKAKLTVKDKTYTGRAPRPSSKYTLKKLKSKKTYYVRIHAYKEAGKETYYSAWVKTSKKAK